MGKAVREFKRASTAPESTDGHAKELTERRTRKGRHHTAHLSNRRQGLGVVPVGGLPSDGWLDP
jgi:hypothetical protein